MAITSEEAKERRKLLDRERHKTPERKRWKLNRDLLAKYGITVEEYEELSKKQGHVCSICGCSQLPSKVCKRLVVDHCHQTGEVRGLLCSHCNFLLGHARDNIDILSKAIEYLVVPQFSR